MHVVNFFAIEITMDQLLKVCVNEFEYAHHVAINMLYEVILLEKNLKVLLKFQCTKGWIFKNKIKYDYKPILQKVATCVLESFWFI